MKASVLHVLLHESRIVCSYHLVLSSLYQRWIAKCCVVFFKYPSILQAWYEIFIVWFSAVFNFTRWLTVCSNQPLKIRFFKSRISCCRAVDWMRFLSICIISLKIARHSWNIFPNASVNVWENPEQERNVSAQISCLRTNPSFFYSNFLVVNDKKAILSLSRLRPLLYLFILFIFIWKPCHLCRVPLLPEAHASAGTERLRVSGTWAEH